MVVHQLMHHHSLPPTTPPAWTSANGTGHPPNVIGDGSSDDNAKTRPGTPVPKPEKDVDIIVTASVVCPLTHCCPVPCPHATPLPNLISVSMPNCECSNALAAIHAVPQLVQGRRPGPFQPRSPPYSVPTSTSTAWAVELYLMNANIPTFTLQIQILFY